MSDDLEEKLDTNKDNKFGDKDNDGLYDFEEVLDIYGNNNAENPKYKYDDATTHGSVLDIYHHFNLSSDKSGYLRDQSFTEANGGFTDYLLWNVNFAEDDAGGNVDGNVIYSNNTMDNVSFSGDDAGGSVDGNVIYSNNIMDNVSFSGFRSGGSDNGAVTYSNNAMDNVSFSGDDAGGSFR